MVIKDATFLTSVANEKNFLQSNKPIIAVAEPLVTVKSLLGVRETVLLAKPVTVPVLV